MMKHPTTKPDMGENVTSDPERRPRSAEQVMSDSHSLYRRKNDDYGDSWKLTGKTIAMWCRHNGLDELRIPVTDEAMISFGLFTRRLDKMIREFNGWFMLEEGDEFQVDEAITETHEDDVPYSAMHTQIAEEYAYADPEDLL